MAINEMILYRKYSSMLRKSLPEIHMTKRSCTSSCNSTRAFLCSLLGVQHTVFMEKNLYVTDVTIEPQLASIFVYKQERYSHYFSCSLQSKKLIKYCQINYNLISEKK